jgi:site-specific recombinase XerD
LNISNGEPIKLKTLTRVADDWIQQRTLPNTQPRSIRIARTDFVKSTAKWLRFLGRLDETHPPLPFANQLEEFLKNLREEQGLADSTVEHRNRTLAQFFLWLTSRSRSIATLDPRDITEYFSAPRSPAWKRATVKSYAECLRTFFRYAESRSWCEPGLAATIDAPPIYSFEPLPQGPAWKDVQRLIASVNGDHPTEIRNRAIILLLAVYGFRIGEVCKLTLDDISWETELIRVRRSKQRRIQDYPLTLEVGGAILRYLREVRPRSRCYREVFLTLRAPYRPILKNVGLRIAILMKRSGIQLPHCGPHLLSYVVSFIML